MRTAVIVTDGPDGGSTSVGGSIVGVVGSDIELTIAADGGLHRADSLGLCVDLVVGDMDSVDGDRLREAEQAGVMIERHPRDKDATDLELALDAACTRGVDRIVVVGSPAGRLGHLLGGLLVLTRRTYRHVQIDALIGSSRVSVVHDHRRVTGRPGEVVSLVPVGGAASGVTTKGLAWPLRAETLEPGTTRGVSNRFVEPAAEVTVRDGCLLVVVDPDAGTEVDTENSEGAP